MTIIWLRLWHLKVWSEYFRIERVQFQFFFFLLFILNLWANHSQRYLAFQILLLLETSINTNAHINNWATMTKPFRSADYNPNVVNQINKKKPERKTFRENKKKTEKKKRKIDVNRIEMTCDRGTTQEAKKRDEVKRIFFFLF